MQPRTERTDWQSSDLAATITAHRDPRIILCELAEAKREAAALSMVRELSDAQHVVLTDLEEQMANLEVEWMAVFRERMGVAWGYTTGVLS